VASTVKQYLNFARVGAFHMQGTYTLKAWEVLGCGCGSTAAGSGGLI